MYTPPPPPPVYSRYFLHCLRTHIRLSTKGLQGTGDRFRRIVFTYRGMLCEIRIGLWYWLLVPRVVRALHLLSGTQHTASGVVEFCAGRQHDLPAGKGGLPAAGCPVSILVSCLVNIIRMIWRRLFLHSANHMMRGLHTFFYQPVHGPRA